MNTMILKVTGDFDLTPENKEILTDYVIAGFKYSHDKVVEVELLPQPDKEKMKKMAKEFIKKMDIAWGDKSVLLHTENGGAFQKILLIDFMLQFALTLAPHPETEWISVKDRLPKERGRYKTIRSGVETIMEFWDDKTWHRPVICNEKGYKGEVTHWQPLPSPPETK